MGKAVARVGDFVFNPNDVHWWASPVPVVGIITAGSSNTFCNNKEVAIADSSKKSSHIICTGTNDFYVSSGSDKVFTNGFATGRSGDATTHCGGQGSILPFCSLNTYA
jgi:uncharacterized Zn-binding protein involved in type VI secretion